MRMTVEADIDADEVLEEISIERLADHLESRRKGSSETPHLLLMRLYEEYQRRGDAPQMLKEYFWIMLGRYL